MKYSVDTQQVQCPYCWETFETVVDSSEILEGGQASYTEDCYVCCRPIVLTISEGVEGKLHLTVEAELA